MTSLNTVSTLFGGTAPHGLKELYGVSFGDGGVAPQSGNPINLRAFNGKSPVLFAFTQHTFTSAGQSGRTGPTLTDCRNAYTVPWVTNTNFFNVSQGIQEWTVPRTATYRIGAKGAQGGGSIGGKGAYIQGDFSLTKGAIVKILVGQQPDIYLPIDSPGGGGTFVTVAPHNTNLAILVVAGGGGGSSNNNYGNGDGGHGTIDTSGGYSDGASTTTGGPVASAGTPGSNGSAGSGESNITVQSGAGFSGDTTNDVYWGGASYDPNFAHVHKAAAYVNGGAGGVMNLWGPNSYSPDPYGRGEGGFGGGGGSGRTGKTNYGSMGGGGGYSGGASGYNASHGGGGGSYNNGSNKVEVVGSSSESSYGNGYVTITAL